MLAKSYREGDIVRLTLTDGTLIGGRYICCGGMIGMVFNPENERPEQAVAAAVYFPDDFHEDVYVRNGRLFVFR